MELEINKKIIEIINQDAKEIDSIEKFSSFVNSVEIFPSSFDAKYKEKYINIWSTMENLNAYILNLLEESESKESFNKKWNNEYKELAMKSITDFIDFINKIAS